MDDPRSSRWSRREFVGGLTAAGTAGLLGIRPQLAAAEPLPETRRIRLGRLPAMCKAPQYLAEELLRAEGFSDVQYVSEPPIEQALPEGLVDISMNFTPDLLLNIDAGQSVVFLAGIHVGCYELFGTDQVRTIRDLKGKTVALYGSGASTGPLGRGEERDLPLAAQFVLLSRDSLHGWPWARALAPGDLSLTPFPARH
jgi:ABC-type nitrate/sulfonate/bicarbonate transport system substrate-binding protein